MKKIYLFIVILISIFPFISPFNASSADYSVETFSTSLSGGNATSSDYESRFSGIYSQATGNISSSVYDVIIGFLASSSGTVENVSAPVCGNSVVETGETCDDGNTNSGDGCSSTCATETSTGTPGTGGGSGGGGGGSSGTAACTYNWICTEWFPNACPKEEIQTRVCVNKGDCSGTQNIPPQIQTCIPGEINQTGPLFDIFAKIPIKNKIAVPGEKINLNIEMINIGDIETLDVFFKYWITDENNKLILEVQDTRAITEKKEFEIGFNLPENLSPGLYKILVEITYDDGKTALAQDTFQVVKSKKIFYMKIFLYVLAALLIISLITTLIIKSGKKKKKTSALISYKKRVSKAIRKK